MTHTALTITLMIGLGLVACGGSDDAVDEADRETVFDPLVQTLEEAEGLDDMALEQKARMDEALRQIEGDDREPEE